MALTLPIHGRGAAENPPNRFDPIQIEPDSEFVDDVPNIPKTVYLHDTARTIICENDSPDVGFRFSINPYRGCEHGCIYCYARPGHEYFGLSVGLDFETKIFVKLEAPKLLRKELAGKKWQPQTISISGVTDCYQPIERKLGITRQCLEVLAEFHNPAGIVTKSHLVTRDIDLLSEMARWRGIVVLVSITTLDADLSARMEPRAASPKRRLETISELSRAGVPVGVMVAPVVPGLTDHEMSDILHQSAAAGAVTCGYVPMRLPFAVKEIFESWIKREYPDRANKVLNRIRSIRGGKLNDSNFNTRMRGQGPFADQMHAMFKLARRKSGLDGAFPSLSADSFRSPERSQLTLF